MTKIIDFNEFKKLAKKAKQSSDPADLHLIVTRLVIIVHDLAAHLEETQEEVAKLKTRQLKLAQWIRGEPEV